MAKARLNLAALQALIALGGYGGRGFIVPSTAVVGLSAALLLDDLNLWQGASDELTDAEIDDIQAMVAQLEYDLMMTDEMYPLDRCKLRRSTSQVQVSGVGANLTFDTVIYDPQDMHSVSGVPEAILILNDGLYLIDFNVSWQGHSVGHRILIGNHWVAATETAHTIGNSHSSEVSSISRHTTNFSAQVYAVAGDYFYGRVNQTSGGDLSVIADNNMPTFAVVRL